MIKDKCGKCLYSHKGKCEEGFDEEMDLEVDRSCEYFVPNQEEFESAFFKALLMKKYFGK